LAFVVICRRAAEPEPEAHFHKVVHVSAPAAPHAPHEVPHAHEASVAHVQHTISAAHPVHHNYYKGKADAEGAVQMMERMMGPMMNM
jgi:hypothetical protein